MPPVQPAEGLLKAGTAMPDAIVLDLGLPIVDGMEVCRRLRRGGNRTPILMLTARDAVDDRRAPAMRFQLDIEPAVIACSTASIGPRALAVFPDQDWAWPSSNRPRRREADSPRPPTPPTVAQCYASPSDLLSMPDNRTRTSGNRPSRSPQRGVSRAI
ncbi:MAG TPA: response regulator [Solirubrobacteraceae bacterium]|nr:response regulator [Solirubrobacteraceae bacterium]